MRKTSSSTTISAKVSNGLKDLQKKGVLSLKPDKFELIITFLSRYPAMVNKSFSSEKVIRGFMTNGQYDPDSKKPNPDTMLATTKAKVDPDTKNKMQHALTELLNTAQREKGYTTDEEMDKYQIPDDQRPSGEKMRRPACIFYGCKERST